jgi:hypothetical protein
MTAAKFKSRIFSMSGFALSSVTNILIFMIFNFHDFGLLLHVACMILLCNHKRMEFGNSHAYREPMCASEKCQWCGEPYFAGAAILLSAILPQIPRWGKHKSLRI